MLCVLGCVIVILLKPCDCLTLEIFDGSGPYRPNDMCIWTLTANVLPARISIGIVISSAVRTEQNADRVFIFECQDQQCLYHSRKELVQFSGYWDGDIHWENLYWSQTGIMQVMFHSDATIQDMGFEFQWFLPKPKSPCSPCILGWYKDIIGNTDCQRCVEHSTTTNTGMQKADCKCNPGAIGPPDGSSCVLCAAGKFQQGNTCNDCPPNTYNEKIGRFNERDCKPCQDSSVSVSGSKSFADCKCGRGVEPGGLPATSVNVVCSGLCECNPAVTMKTPTSGTVFDGPGAYRVNDHCIWTLTADVLPASISIHMVQSAGVNTEPIHDVVKIIECEDAACSVQNVLKSYQGYWDGDVFFTNVDVSKTGIMRVEFTSDFLDNFGGFMFDWELDSSTMECKDCGVGKYKDLVENVACTDCAENSYTSTTSAITDSVCKCNLGSTSQNNIGPCVLCEKGKFRPKQQEPSCNKCPSNTFLDMVGSDKAADCTSCPNNMISNMGSKYESDCKCASGMNPTSIGCSLCAAGKFLENGMCTDCEAGKFSDGIVIRCSDCGPGKYAPNTNSTNCDLCELGQVSEDRSECELLQHPKILSGENRIVFMHFKAETTVKSILATVDPPNWQNGDTVTIYENGARGLNPLVFVYNTDWSPVNIDPIHHRDNVYVIRTPRSDKAIGSELMSILWQDASGVELLSVQDYTQTISTQVHYLRKQYGIDLTEKISTLNADYSYYKPFGVRIINNLPTHTTNIDYANPYN